MPYKKLLFSLVVLFIFISYIDSKVIEGHLDIPKRFVFASKFTFSEGNGKCKFSSSDIHPGSDKDQDKMLISFYDDQKNEKYYWNSIYDDDDSSENCKVKVSHQEYEQQQAYINGSTWTIRFKESKPHTYFMAVSDCSLDKGEDFKMHVKIEWTNPGNGWYAQFSLEDQDLLTIYLVFTLVWLIITPFYAYGLYLQFKAERDTADWTARLFHTVILLQYLSLFLYLIHYSVYASDGVGVPGFLIAADVFNMLETVLFFLVLIMIGSGTSHILKINKIVIGVFTLLILIYFGFFVWQEVYPGINPEENSYKWETAPGIVLLCTRFCVWLVFIGTVTKTFIKSVQNQQKMFLTIFAILCSAWFLYLPLVASICAAVPFYYRWKSVLGISLTVNLFAYIFLALLIIPNPLSKHFHADLNKFKTASKQDILIDEDENSPYGTL